MWASEDTRIVLIGFSLALDFASSYDVATSSQSKLPIKEPAAYNCRLESLWTQERHPQNYPERPQFQQPLIVTHNDNYEMYKMDGIASDSFATLTETGVSVDLVSSILAVHDETNAIEDINVGFDMDLATSTRGQRIVDISASEHHHLLTAVTRLAPSPDWFTGFDQFSAQSEQGFWRFDFTIETYALDAGTRTDSIVPTPARQPIGPAYGSGALPVARWTCTLTTPEPPTASPIRFTPEPTMAPTTAQPSSVPSQIPSRLPTAGPSAVPSRTPSAGPTLVPSMTPSQNPTTLPSGLPSGVPSALPTTEPSQNPTEAPTLVPSAIPSMETTDMRVTTNPTGSNIDGNKIDTIATGATSSSLRQSWAWWLLMFL